MSTIGIFLVESDFEWRDRIWSYLSQQPDMHMIGAVCTKEEALDQFQYADLILMDSHIEGISMEGIRIAKEMKAIKPSRVIMMTDHTDLDTMLDGLLAGVNRFVSKQNLSDIPRIVRQIMVKHSQSDISAS